MVVLNVIISAVILGLSSGLTEIIERPQTKYVLAGDTAIFHCNTRAYEAYWLINGDTIEHEIKQRYVSQGFTFSEDERDGFYNLTMTVMASAQTNNSVIRCRASDDAYNHRPISREAYLHVFTTFRPHQPIVQAYFSVFQHLYITIIERLLWPNYEISEFRVNVTDNGSFLAHHSISVNGTNVYQLNQTLPNSVIHSCTSLSIIVSALSPIYGQSEVSLLVKEITRAPGNFSEHAINPTVLFYPNGTPFLSLTVQLPVDVCTYQQINYTIMIMVDHNKTNSSHKAAIAGPLTFSHQGSGLVSHNVFGDFELDQRYSVWVLVETTAGSSESKRYYFNTSFNIIIPGKPCDHGASQAQGADVFSYKLAIGVCLSLAILILSALAIVILYILFYRQKKSSGKIKKSTNNVRNGMVDNPMYDGPVYESVHTQFDTLASTKSTGDEHCNSPTCISSSSIPALQDKSTVLYVDQPRSKSFVTSYPSVPNDESESANILRAESVSVPVTKKSGKQQNKLNLTLTLTGSDSTGSGTTESKSAALPYASGPTSAINQLRDIDENYAVMLVSEWSELSPEDTVKYQE